jgi:class 3 adenylate cyclase/predicted ATPase
VDIAAWLRELGLERYEQVFQDSEVEPEILAELTDQDLKELGIPLGPRRKLAKAIAALYAEHAAPPEDTIPPVSSTPVGQAERRQLTVMFVDLAGSTALSARLDPEDMGRVIRAYQNTCTEVIERWGGHVAKYMGDGVLAYFGWPQAHEDDAECAVRAGLELAGRIAELDALGARTLAARIGIATGLVMVGEPIGEGAAQEQTVVGETPNLAARLQALAAPGSVVISQATRRLVGGLFELADLGPRRLKGFAAPIAAWRVTGEGRAEGRFEALHGEHLTPLVGREDELGILLERWAWARDGDGQVVLIAGEAGIGKSRMLRTLRERLGDEPHTLLSHYCSPHHTNSALYPVIDLLERAARLERDAPPEEQLAKLEAVLAGTRDVLDEVVPLLAALLGVPTGGHYRALSMTPEMQKRRTLQALLDQLAGLAAQQPVLALYEDVHWIDPSTLELLGLVIERVRQLPVLALITFRPEFQPPWMGQEHVTSLTMSRLGRRQETDLVARVTGDKPLPAAIVEQIVARTDGVPLFVEELTKTVLESGLLADAGDRYELSSPLPPLAIPSTLHDSLLARLDRLAPVKEVAQIGAAIGREFSHALLAAVASQPEPELQTALDQLVAAELVFRRGTLPEASYTFKHALVQEAAYGTLLKSRRQHIHARIVGALKERFPQTAAAQPEILARHLTEAGEIERAIPYWREAGQHAAERSAFKEATAHIEEGLALVTRLADSTERDRQELGLRLALGSVLTAMKGPAAAEVGQAYARARELCHDAGAHAELFTATWNLWHFYAHGPGSQMEKARRLADELLTIAEQRSDPEFLLQAHHAAWTTSLRMPNMLAACRDHAEQGLALYDPQQHRTHRFIYGGHDPGVCCRNVGAWTLWLLGYPDQAIGRAMDAVNLAQNLAHPLSTILAQSFLCFLHYCRREQDLTRERAGTVMAVCAEHEIAPQYLTAGRILQGWVLAVQENANEGLAEVRQGLIGFRSTGMTLHCVFLLAILAEVCGGAGELDQGLEAVAEAFQMAEETGDQLWVAEIHRLKGDLLLAQSVEHWPQAEACYARALEVARAQGAKSLELRAAMSLVRLWRDQGKRAEAHDLLAPVYGWFTEGFETADLKDAKALLDEVG